MEEKERKKKNETYDIVICSIQALQEACRAPASPENNYGLLRGIVRKLWTRVLVQLSDVVKDTASGDDGDEGNATECLEELAPSGNLWLRWGKGSGGWWLEMSRTREVDTERYESVLDNEKKERRREVRTVTGSLALRATRVDERSLLLRAWN